MPSRRPVLLAIATVLTLAGCSGAAHPQQHPTSGASSSSGSSGPSSSPSSSQANPSVDRVAASARALLPIQHHGTHPGAAALRGDVRPVPRAAFTPTVTRAPHDTAGYGACQVVQPASKPRYCTFGDKIAPKRTIALVGDSVAGEWLGALDKIAKVHHWKIVLALHSRCPWTATMTVNLGHTEPYTSCHNWGASVQRAMLRLKPTVVITTDRPVLGTPGLAPGAAASTKIGRGMATYWRQLVAHHIGVIGIRESPEMGINIPSCMASSSAGQCTVARSTAVARTTPVLVANRLVSHGARLLDLTSLICTSRACHPVVGNVLVYQDLHHLTNTYALTTAPYLERMLLRVPLLAAG